MLDLTFHGVMVLVAIIVLALLFIGPWQTLVVDVVRQRAFEIRDNALLWSYDNDRLDDNSYLEFRDAVNHSIRYFEEMSFMKILTLAFLNSRQKNRVPKRESFGFMADPHFHKEFNSLTTNIAVGLVLRSSAGLFLCMALLPVAMFAYIMNGQTNTKSIVIASKVRREVQTDLRLAF